MSYIDKFINNKASKVFARVGKSELKMFPLRGAS